MVRDLALTLDLVNVTSTYTGLVAYQTMWMTVSSRTTEIWPFEFR